MAAHGDIREKVFIKMTTEWDELEKIPESKTRDHREYKLHIAALAHINSAFIGSHNPGLKCWHVPNETKDATDAFFKKQMGVLPGVLDFCLGWPVSKVGVLEIKPLGKILTPAQNKYSSWAASIGWHTGAAWSVRDVHRILQVWGLKAAHHTIIEPDYATKEEKQKRGADLLWGKRII